MPPSNRGSLGRLLRITGLAVLYYCAAKWGLLLAIVQPNVTAVWPPTGIALAALLIGGWRLWPGVFLGAFAANFSTAGTAWTSFGIATGNTLEALAGFVLVSRFADGRYALEKSTNLFKFALLGGLTAPLVSSTVGVGTLALAGMTGQSPFRDIWMTWWLGDVGGALLFAPPILLWPRTSEWRLKINVHRWLEAASLAILFLLTCWFLYGGNSLLSRENANAEFLFFPLLLWLAVRFQPFISAMAVLFVGLASIRGTLMGWGPFHGASLNQSLLLLQTFMGMTSVTVLSLARGVTERREAEEELRWSHSNLQLRVLERTEDLARTNQDLREKSQELEEALKGLAEREERLRLLVENVQDYAIFLLDPDGKIASWNVGAQRIKGYGAEEIIGRHFSCFYIPEDVKSGKPERLLRQAFQEGRVEDEGWRLRKDGTRYWADTILTALKDPEGRLKGFAKITRDMTQRKQIEELARSNQELEQFAYLASHDLQEPLRMVASYVQLLERKYSGHLDEDAKSYIGQAVDGVKRMQALIHDLLAYSRVGSQKRSFDRVDFEEVLAEALRNLEAGVREAGAHITRDPLPTVVGDYGQFLQLLQNLIGNSLKFRGKEASLIHVGAVQKGQEWLFSVKDNGIGINPQYADKIFEIFKRLHTRSEYPGTGIGLAICRKVVSQYGGRIWVESTEGEGASFYWTLPVAKGASLEPKPH